MTRYSIETKDCGKNISKSFSSKEITVRKFLIILSNLSHMHLKLLQKKPIQNTAEATGDFIGNRIELQKNY